MGYREYQLPALYDDPLRVEIDPLQNLLTREGSVLPLDTGIALSVFACLDQSPDWTQFDYRTDTPDEQGRYLLVLPSAAGRTYYVRVYARAAPETGATFTIQAHPDRYWVYLPLTLRRSASQKR